MTVSHAQELLNMSLHVEKVLDVLQELASKWLVNAGITTSVWVGERGRRIRIVRSDRTFLY
jgi:hypothetical protein